MVDEKRRGMLIVSNDLLRDLLGFTSDDIVFAVEQTVNDQMQHCFAVFMAGASFEEVPEACRCPEYTMHAERDDTKPWGFRVVKVEKRVPWRRE